MLKILAAKYCLGLDSTVEGKEAILSVLKWATKDQLSQFLKTVGSEIPKKALKDDLLTLCLSLSPENLYRLAQEYTSLLALHPTDVEEFLGCSKTERKRWTEEKRLTVIEYREFKYGQFPVYDCLDIIKITPEQIKAWRTLYQEKVKENRSAGAKKAHLTKTEGLKFTYNQAIARWSRLDADQLDILILAYWTRYVYKLEKYFRQKMFHTHNNTELYSQKCIELSELGKQAMVILFASPYSRLDYYDLCITDRLVYGDSFYHLVLEVPNAEEVFCFHLRPGIGGEFFPKPRDLPATKKPRDEGIFHLGRRLKDEELIAHTENVILREINSILGKFDDDWILNARNAKILTIKSDQEASQERIEKLKNLSLDYSTIEQSWLKSIRGTFIGQHPKITSQSLYQKVRDKITEKLALTLEAEILAYPEFNLSFVAKLVESYFSKEKLTNLIGGTPQDLILAEKQARKKLLEELTLTFDHQQVLARITDIYSPYSIIDADNLPQSLANLKNELLSIAQFAQELPDEIISFPQLYYNHFKRALDRALPDSYLTQLLSDLDIIFVSGNYFVYHNFKVTKSPTQGYRIYEVNDKNKKKLVDNLTTQEEAIAYIDNLIGGEKQETINPTEKLLAVMMAFDEKDEITTFELIKQWILAPQSNDNAAEVGRKQNAERLGFTYQEGEFPLIAPSPHGLKQSIESLSFSEFYGVVIGLAAFGLGYDVNDDFMDFLVDYVKRVSP